MDGRPHEELEMEMDDGFNQTDPKMRSKIESDDDEVSDNEDQYNNTMDKLGKFEESK